MYHNFFIHSSVNGHLGCFYGLAIVNSAVMSQEIDENNRIGKSRSLFKKIRDTFHAKTGSIKDRNGRDLTEAEDIKKRWQEYTEELYKKDLHDPDNHDGVITHLEPDILEREVKLGLRKHHYEQS